MRRIEEECNDIKGRQNNAKPCQAQTFCEIFGTEQATWDGLGKEKNEKENWCIQVFASPDGLDV